MSKARQALQQALEALELAKLNGKAGMYPAEIEEIADAIAALRAALAEPQEPVAKVELMTTGGNAGLATRIVEIDDHLRERLRPGQMLYTHPAPQRQPEVHPVTGEQLPTSTAGWLHYVTDRTSAAWQEGYERGLKREGQRQPLTDEEIVALLGDVRAQVTGHVFLSFARAVERAHGITGKQP